LSLGQFLPATAAQIFLSEVATVRQIVRQQVFESRTEDGGNA
jgi:hypothetical protein